MKTLFALILSIIAVAFAADVIAGEFGYFAKDEEELYGTWVNMNYAARPPQKLVFNPNGTAWSTTRADSNEPGWRTRYLITGKWNDAKGNIMYKSHWIGNWGEEGYTLSRISNSGNTLEYIFDHDEYPKQIDPEGTFYRKYTRK